MIGTTISHYRIVSKLGHGGMGVVYLAEDTVLGRQVAIKTLTSDSTANQQFRLRFLREARAISSLSHRNIAIIHDYGETDDGQPFIVMEFVKGQTLADLINQAKLPVERGIEITVEVAQALAEAHRCGIIHRDIKPSNVAINEKGQVKVLDFGLAKQLNLGPLESPSDPERPTLVYTQTREGVILGTPMYLSPEQALGVEVDARSDLFSLGALLYECITGKPAFFGVNALDICAKVIREDPLPPSKLNGSVSAELDRVVLKALAKNPEQRYGTAEEMIEALGVAANAPQGNTGSAAHQITPEIRGRYRVALAPFHLVSRLTHISVGYWAALLVVIAIISLGFWLLVRSHPYIPSPLNQDRYTTAVEAMRQGSFFRASKILQEVVKDENQFALAHARLAECWTELDSSDRAKDELIRAKDLVSDPSSLLPEDGLRLQAITDTVQRDFAKAVRNYITLASSVPAAEKKYALVDLGRAFEKNEQFDKAIVTYQEATRLDSQLAAPFVRLGVLLGRRLQYKEAYAALDQAFKLFDTGTEIEGLIEVLLQRAVLLGPEGKVTDARKQLLQALDKSAVLESKEKRIKVLLNLSNTEIIAGNSDQAQLYASQALELAKANRLDNLTMQGLIDIGNSYLNRGNFTEAEKNFNEALRLAELYKGSRSKARALLSLASLRSQQSDIAGARSFFERALPFYEQGGYRKEVFLAYVIMGRAEQSAGDYDAARQRFDDLLKLAKQSGDPPSVALAQEGLGRAFLEQENFSQALIHYDANYEIVKSLGTAINIGYTANNRAEVLWQLGRSDDARIALAEALAIAEPQGRAPMRELQAAVHLTKAHLALSERNGGEALTEAQKALDLGGDQSKATIVEVGYVSGLAQTLLTRAPEGRQRCEKAVKAARELGVHLLLSNALLAVAESALLAGDESAAIASAAEAQQRFAAGKQFESEWRAWLIQARAYEKAGNKSQAKQLANQASKILAALEKNLGGDEYKRYLSRPDIQNLQKEFRLLVTG